MSFDAGRLANPALQALHAYDPGHDLPALRARFGSGLVELGSNENPLGPSAQALDAARAALLQAHRYPDPRGGNLRGALATHYGLAPEQFALGNGSHELLILLAQCFAGPAQAVMYSQYAFAVFALAAAGVGAPTIVVPALPRDHPTAPLGHDLAAMAESLRDDVRLIYLANPNNPTGSWFDVPALENFLAHVSEDTLVVVDEAYGEYLDAPGVASAHALQTAHPNLVVTRTFSKAYALAGLRVGYLTAHPSVVAVLERLRESFNVNAVALAAATAALTDRVHLQRSVAFNHAERAWLAAELERHGYTVLPSRTNFLLLDAATDARALEHHLFERGVIVRPMRGYGLAHMLRISVGNRRENERLLEALP